jgi:hypothetical protein
MTVDAVHCVTIQFLEPPPPRKANEYVISIQWLALRAFTGMQVPK